MASWFAVVCLLGKQKGQTSHSPPVTLQSRRREPQQAAGICLEGKAEKSRYGKSLLVPKPKATTWKMLWYRNTTMA